MQETQEMRVWSLRRENLLEKEMATHSSILAWEILWTEEPEGHNPWGRRVEHNWETERAHKQDVQKDWGFRPKRAESL